MVTHRFKGTLAAVLFVGGCSLWSSGPVLPPSTWDDALEGLDIVRGHLGWSGIALGDSRKDVEAVLGKTLSLERSDPDACGAFVHQSGGLGTGMTMQFGDAGEDAPLVFLHLRMPPPMVRAPELRARLKSEIQGLRYRPSPHLPDLPESMNPLPTYVWNRGEAVFLKPDEGIVLTYTACLD